TLAAFFRGRLTVCLVKGVLTSIGLLLFGVPLAIPIGLAAGFLSLLPYVGIYLTLVPAMLLSWFDAGSLGTLIGIVAFYGAIEALEGLVLIPKLLGREVGLHPLTIIVTLLVFGKLFGLVGVLLSVPLAAIAKILADEFVMPLIRDLADIDDPEPESS
ncbi:MAG: AI-2E family transporter, partial [Planctomycetota bacterium]